MLRKYLVIILCLLLVLCCACGSSNQSSDQKVKRYTYDDLSYEVPSSWSVDTEDPDVAFMQYSDDENKLVMVTKYEADSASRGKMFDNIGEYEPSDYKLASGDTSRGAIYENEDGWLVAQYSIDASNGDEYRIAIAQKDFDADLVAAVMNSVDIK